jgi:hypothetical protein
MVATAFRAALPQIAFVPIQNNGAKRGCICNLRALA